MTKNNLVLMTIPVLAAILIGGTLSPAYAGGNSPANCEKLIVNLVDALEDDNIRKALGLLKAVNASCLEFVDPQCAALFIALLTHLLDDVDGNDASLEALVHALEAAGCSGN